MTTHQCNSCGLDLPLDAFNTGKTSKTGWKCRRCLAEYRKKWRAANPEKGQMPASYYRDYNREIYRFAKQGITKADFEAMWREQGGCCAICSYPFLDPTKVAIDHDHACCPAKRNGCGQCIRGLLCSNCNTAIGLMKDDRDRLLSAVQYLERWDAR